MAAPLLEMEGTPQEIMERLSDFAGQKLRIIVLPVTEDGTDTSESRPIHEVLSALAAEIPPEELSRLPADFTDQLDHHIYGIPKR
jgi:hypothetical protein